jgi:hypothetical protein
MKNQKHWLSIAYYLVKESSLEMVVNLANADEYSCSGNNNGNEFRFEWRDQESLTVTMLHYSKPLIDAFSIAIGNSPFCQYSRNDFIVIEWSKSSKRKLKEIKQIRDIRSLTLFLPILNKSFPV